jgi:hypothetical protein
MPSGSDDVRSLGQTGCDMARGQNDAIGPSDHSNGYLKIFRRGSALPTCAHGRMVLSCLMWTRCKNCDSCQIAPATHETESGFFLCDECEAVVVVAFEEFALWDGSLVGA